MTTSLVFAPAAAHAEPGRVSFAGPTRCAEEELDRALRRFLDRADADAAVPDDVSVRVAARASGRGFVLLLDVVRADGVRTHRRVRHAHRCDLLIETAALIAALAIDPEVAGRHVTGPDEPGGAEPEPHVDAEAREPEGGVAAPEGQVGPEGGVAQPEGHVGPELHAPEAGPHAPHTDPSGSETEPRLARTEVPPEPATQPPAPEPAPPASDAELRAALPPRDGVHVTLGVGPTLGFHLFPAIAGGGQLTVGVLRRRMRLELRLAVLGLSRVGLGEPGWSVRIVDYGSDVVGCYAPRFGAWAVPLCGTLGVAAESARASAQVPEAGHARRSRVSLGQRAGVRFSPRRRYELGVDAEVDEQLRRPVFGVAGTDRLVRARRVAYRATVTWAAVWP